MEIIKKIVFNQVFRFVAWYMVAAIIATAFAIGIGEVTLKIPYLNFTEELK